MRPVTCHGCGSDQHAERRMDYLYSHRGQYLLVPNTPVTICCNCGMMYYDAAVLKKIEHHFFAIHQHQEEPDRYIEIPTKTYA